ncbi:MAG: hypothetical protein Q4C98_01135 [Capnocytophaga sp.]|nr:hypothetical protein [Capnocytophaga sp.]
MKARIFFEYAYLAICIFSIYVAVGYWNTSEMQSFYRYVIFAVVSLGMFFLRRYTRKKNENKSQKP